jgi:hypothetical protein
MNTVVFSFPESIEQPLLLTRHADIWAAALVLLRAAVALCSSLLHAIDTSCHNAVQAGLLYTSGAAVSMLFCPSLLSRYYV